jgi:hypothetical protein
MTWTRMLVHLSFVPITEKCINNGDSRPIAEAMFGLQPLLVIQKEDAGSDSITSCVLNRDRRWLAIQSSEGVHARSRCSAASVSAFVS